MNLILGILLAAGIPSTISGIIIGWFVKRQNDKDKAREKINVLLIQGVKAAIALGEASALALKRGKTNGETEAALEYAVNVKHDISNFLTEQGIKNIY